MDDLNLKKILIAGTGVVLTLLLLFFAWKVSTAPSTAQKANIKLTQNDWVKGAKSPESTLVEYGDFQCPACGAYYYNVKKIHEKYKEKIQIVYRHFPLREKHQNSAAAAQAAEAAGLQGKFWQMHDLLFEKQKEWSDKKNIDETLVEYAKSLKLDVDKFKKDYKSESVINKINEDQQSGLTLGVNSTPTFFFNGLKLDGFQSLEEFDKLIADELNKKTKK